MPLSRSVALAKEPLLVMVAGMILPNLLGRCRRGSEAEGLDRIPRTIKSTFSSPN